MGQAFTHSTSDAFLGIQKHGLMQKIRNTGYINPGQRQPFLYQKPGDICDIYPFALPEMWQDTHDFGREWRETIADIFPTYGLELSIIGNTDPENKAVKAFLNRRYSPEMASEICAFDLYRFQKYGHGLVIKDAADQIHGCIFEVGYETREKTSYTIRLGVDQQHEGRGFGFFLMIYSSLLAMEQGSRVKRGIIQFQNMRSLYLNLNKVGWVCDGFNPQVAELGPFFEIMMPLDPAGLTSNRISPDKLLRFIETQRAEVDYRLIPEDDFDTVAKMYADTDFVVCAVVLPGWIDHQGYFFAMTRSALRFQSFGE